MKHLALAFILLVPQDDKTRAIRDYAAGETDKRPDLAGLDWKAVRDAIVSWKATAPEKTETELSHSHTLSNGHEATFFYYVPKSYDPAKQTPLTIFLHGGVNSPQAKRGSRQWSVWKAEADKLGWIIASPSGTEKCVWWKPEGEEHVIEAIRHISARHAVDRNRIYLSGFSDGASGAYSLGMTRTDLFAACVAWNGAVGVVTSPQGGNTPFYTVNAKLTAWRATHGGTDELYPAKSQEPVIGQMKEAGVAIEWKNFEEVGHDGGRILGGDRAFIDEWLPNQKRNPLPETIDWTTHDAKLHGRAAWIRILGIANRTDDPFATEKDYTFPIGQAGPARPALGIQIDQQFAGPGVKIVIVSEGSGAEEAGVKAGDVILKANDQEVKTFPDLRAVLAKAKEGDTIKLVVERGNESVEIKCPFRMIKINIAKVPAAGRIRAARKGNEITVLARRVAKFEILVSPDAFDLGKEIVVTVNGKPAFKGSVTPDAGVLLDEVRARHGDASVIYVARVVIEVPDSKEY